MMPQCWFSLEPRRPQAHCTSSCASLSHVASWNPAREGQIWRSSAHCCRSTVGWESSAVRGSRAQRHQRHSYLWSCRRADAQAPQHWMWALRQHSSNQCNVSAGPEVQTCNSERHCVPDATAGKLRAQRVGLLISGFKGPDRYHLAALEAQLSTVTWQTSCQS